MVVEISYADAGYEKAQKLHIKMAKKHGHFDKCIAYTPKDLDIEFVTKNAEIMKRPRGGGYWIWKSYIINQTLSTMQIGDYLLYCDTGAYIRKPVQKLIQVMNKNNDDIMCFEIYNHLEQEWTKRDVFEYFNMETEECKQSNQIMATMILIKKTKVTVKIFEEYEKACQYKELITDQENQTGKENFPGFKENRHDQSILSVLLKKYHVTPYKDPSQYGLYQKSPYRHRCMKNPHDYITYERSEFPMMFILHRNRNINWKGMMCKRYEIIKEYYRYIRDPKRPI